MMAYVTNAAGDVCAVISNGESRPFDPEIFGWAADGGRTRPNQPCTIEQLAEIPGFEVSVLNGLAATPGPRPSRSVPWGEWTDGEAPPAAARSKNGVDGTTSYSNRLTDALGLVAQRLPKNPERSPFLVHDFVGGRTIEVYYTPPALTPEGPGQVYILDDSDAFKIGYTSSPVAKRISELQTGNPRLIQRVATISPTTNAVEKHLQTRFAAWSRQREWFQRAPMIAAVNEARGWEPFLRSHLPPGEWVIVLEPDYT